MGFSFCWGCRPQSVSKKVFSSFVLLCLLGKYVDLFFTRESSVVLSLSLSISMSLNLRSNSLRSFLNSAMLLLGVGQNLRPSFSTSISSFESVSVDRLMTLGFLLSSLVLSFCEGFLKNDCEGR